MPAYFLKTVPLSSLGLTVYLFNLYDDSTVSVFNVVHEVYPDLVDFIEINTYSQAQLIKSFCFSTVLIIYHFDVYSYIFS